MQAVRTNHKPPWRHFRPYTEERILIRRETRTPERSNFHPDRPGCHSHQNQRFEAVPASDFYRPFWVWLLVWPLVASPRFSPPVSLLVLFVAWPRFSLQAWLLTW